MRLAVLALFALPAVACAESTVDLKLRLPKGKTWTVTQKAMLQSDCTDEAGKSAGPQTGKAEVSLEETWTDESLEEEGGKPTQLRRTWASAVASVTPAGGDVVEAKAWEGCELKLVKGFKGSTATAVKGTPDKKSLTLLGGAPPEAAAILLPGRAVKTGDTWEISEGQTRALLDALASTLPSATGGSVAQAELAAITKEFTPGKALCEAPALKAQVTAVADGKVTIEASGTRKIPGQGKEKKGAGEARVSALLIFDTKTGAPERLELEAVQETGPSPAWIQFIGGGKTREFGLRDSWVVTRDYVAGE